MSRPTTGRSSSFLDDAEAGKYADVPDSFEALGRLTVLTERLSSDRIFVEWLETRARELRQAMAGDLDLEPMAS